jgi:hypothetical protein
VIVHSPPEKPHGVSSPGSVVAEIGGDHGALIVHVPPEWRGEEIEIRRASEPWAGRHVAVLQRRLPQRDDFSAFFPSLERGEYQVRCRPTPGLKQSHLDCARSVVVVGGGVVELHLGVSAPMGSALRRSRSAIQS